MTTREPFRRLSQRLEEIDREGELGGNRLFYLATPPDVYLKIIEQLGKAGLAKPKSEKSWTRVIIEKPFGHDEASARGFEREGAERVRANLRFTGSITTWAKRPCRTCWSSDSATGFSSRCGTGTTSITFRLRRRNRWESNGAEAFYESAGALRDMIQSHVLQLTSLVAMEAPATFDATAVRNEKIKVLQSIRPFSRGDRFGNRWCAGSTGRGPWTAKQVPGYRQEPGVNPNSATETFVALKLYVDNWRWSGVPFYLRTGKRLARPTHRSGDPIQEGAAHGFSGRKRGIEFAGAEHSAG